MDKEYYILWYRLNKTDRYLIWFSDDTDGVVTGPSGDALSFNSRDELLGYASANNLSIVSEEPELHNLDLVYEWIEGNDPDLINFSEFNNIWNLWADIAGSTGRNFDEDKSETDKVYDKLFWACNLPSVTPEDKKYIPEWTEDELKTMRELFLKGIAMFNDAVVPYSK